MQPGLFGYSLADLTNQFVLLIRTDQQRRGKSLAVLYFGRNCRLKDGVGQPNWPLASSPSVISACVWRSEK